MKYNPERAGIAKMLKGPEMRKVCTLAAADRLARMRSLVHKHSGETAASGHLVHGLGVKGDRVRVSIVFGGAATQLQWGVYGRPATRFMTRALDVKK